MPTMTPGASALSVAQKSVTAPESGVWSSGYTVNNQNGQVFGNATSGPYTLSNAQANGYTPPATNQPSTLREFIQVAGSQGGGLKEAQKMFQDSLLAGTSSINGNNQFYRDDKGVLKTGIAPTSNDIVNKLNQYFNGKQITAFEGRNEPTTNTTDPYSAVFGNVFGNTKQPETYNSIDEYKKLRDNYGIDDLEAQINELSAQESEQIALTRKRLDTASNSPVALGVISGRQGEIERQDSTRLGDIQRAKNNLVNQLNTKNSSIKMFMDFHKEDYSMASDRFNTQFSQAMQMQNLFRQQKQDEYSEYKDERDAQQKQKDQEQDNYRAMYNTVFNGISTGAVDPTQFTPEMKAQMTTLEMKSGLPAGFTEMIRNKNPKADIIYQGTTTDNDGNQTLNVVMRDQSGKMTTQNISVGKEGVKGRYQYKEDGSVFDTATGATLDNSSMETADFRAFAYKYPNEASLKNNNPAGITFNDQFGETLTRNGIKWEKGTERSAIDPKTGKKEGGNYFSFPNVAEGMKAYTLLWSLPSYQNMTVGNALNRWGTGSLSGVDKTKRISDLTPEETQTLQMAQLKKESPGFLSELQKLGTKKETKVDAKEKDNFYGDIDSYRKKVFDGEVSVDQAVSWFKSKYPGAGEQHISWLKSQLQSQ